MCRSPCATVSDRAILTLPFARSISLHLSATSSPRRAPVSAARATAVPSTGSLSSAALISADTCDGVGTFISVCQTRVESTGPSEQRQSIPTSPPGDRPPKECSDTCGRWPETVRRPTTSIGRIDDFGLEVGQLNVPQRRPDPTLYLPAVLVERARTLTPLPRLEPLVEQLAHRGRSAADLARLHLRHQGSKGLSCSTLSALEGSRHLTRLSGNRVASDVGPKLPVSWRSLSHRAGLNSANFSGLEVLMNEHPRPIQRIAGRVSYDHPCRDLLGSRPCPGVFAHRPGFTFLAQLVSVTS